jgi:hypothetical protein
MQFPKQVQSKKSGFANVHIVPALYELALRNFPHASFSNEASLVIRPPTRSSDIPSETKTRFALRSDLVCILFNISFNNFIGI